MQENVLCFRTANCWRSSNIRTEYK